MFYSPLSTFIGSTAAARVAGIALAATPIIVIPLAASTSVNGSTGLSPKSNARVALPAAAARPVPATRPIASRANRRIHTAPHEPPSQHTHPRVRSAVDTALLIME
jgi:hypothetical protein